MYRIEINQEDEVEEIRQTLNYYTEAFQNWDGDKLIKAFHPEASRMSNYKDRRTLISYPAYGWIKDFKRYKEEGLEYSIKTDILKVIQSGRIAYANKRFGEESSKIVINTTDFLTLVKVNNSWKIINKSVHTERASKEEGASVTIEDLEPKRNEKQEVSKIRKTLRNYFEGSLQQLGNIIHSEAKNILLDSDRDTLTIETKTMNEWEMGLERTKNKYESVKMNIDEIDQTGIAACARILWILKNPNQINIVTEYLTLLKFEEGWKIIVTASEMKM